MIAAIAFSAFVASLPISIMAPTIEELIARAGLPPGLTPDTTAIEPSKDAKRRTLARFRSPQFPVVLIAIEEPIQSNLLPKSLLQEVREIVSPTEAQVHSDGPEAADSTIALDQIDWAMEPQWIEPQRSAIWVLIRTASKDPTVIAVDARGYLLTEWGCLDVVIVSPASADTLAAAVRGTLAWAERAGIVGVRDSTQVAGITLAQLMLEDLGVPRGTPLGPERWVREFSLGQIVKMLMMALAAGPFAIGAWLGWRSRRRNLSAS